MERSETPLSTEEARDGRPSGQSGDRNNIVVAVPSVSGGGLEARRSSHFGKSPCFTLVALSGGEIGDVRVVANEAHSEGGCRGAVQLLVSSGVNALVAGGIGARPLSILNESGIDVYFERQLKTVSEAVDAFAAGSLQPIGLDQTCSHHQGYQHEHSC
jgi:predicted Fe-Mo cluster-binding NifX family protein